MHSYLRIPLLAVLLLCGCFVSPGLAVDPIKPKPKLTTWLPLWEVASMQSRKEKRPILAYFCGSDWEAFTTKLDRDVMNTELFRDWAAKNVILFKVDFPRDAKQSANIKTQNDQLKQRYGIIKVPTFILMDFSGTPFNRSGWDQAKLRDDESKDQPKAWIAYLTDAIKNKPPDEALVRQKDLTSALKFGKKHFLSTVMLINHDVLPRTMQVKADLTDSQQFVRFLNRNVDYVEIQWPYDSDTTPEAMYFRQFAKTQNLSETAALQLAVVDMQTSKVNFRLTAINPQRVDQIISLIENNLPKPDYNGGWIEDYHLAQHIAQSQKRYIFICFTSKGTGDPAVNFSQRIFTEIFDTPEFVKYARKKLVTVDADFPNATGAAPPPVNIPAKAAPEKFVDTPAVPFVEETPAPVAAATKPAVGGKAAATQPAGLIAQNKALAEQFAIRGYPSIIVLNPQGQKIADAKYMKGGPDEFLKQLDAAVKNDEERRAFLAGDQ